MGRRLPHRSPYAASNLVCAGPGAWRRRWVAADARDAQPDVDGRSLPLVKPLRVEIDLAVGDGNQVRRNVGRDVAGLRAGDRQRGQTAAAQPFVQPGGPFQYSTSSLSD